MSVEVKMNGITVSASPNTSEFNLDGREGQWTQWITCTCYCSKCQVTHACFRPLDWKLLDPEFYCCMRKEKQSWLT